MRTKKKKMNHPSFGVSVSTSVFIHECVCVCLCDCVYLYICVWRAMICGECSLCDNSFILFICKENFCFVLLLNQVYFWIHSQ